MDKIELSKRILLLADDGYCQTITYVSLTKQLAKIVIEEDRPEQGDAIDNISRRLEHARQKQRERDAEIVIKLGVYKHPENVAKEILNGL